MQINKEQEITEKKGYRVDNVDWTLCRVLKLMLHIAHRCCKLYGNQAQSLILSVKCVKQGGWLEGQYL